MKKKLFKNYNFSFDKNEARIINNFCKQAINQMQADSQFSADIKALSSIMDKISESPDDVRMTKDEKTRLTRHMRTNRDHIEKEISKSWFVKRWMMKSVLQQYNNILLTHFSD